LPPEKKPEPTLDLKPPSVWERVARDFAEALAHPCRRDPGTGSTLYYLGFSHLGHRVRRWEGVGWGDPFPVPASTIKKSVATALPEGAEAPENDA